jgi:predicted acetyltransferase
MPIRIRDARNSTPDRSWIQSQYLEYLEDLSQLSMNSGMFPVVGGEYGERESELMARWFTDDSAHPLIILKDDKPAGFALVSRPPRNRRDQIDFRMSEFFVAVSARRLGVGKDAARLIFDRFAGSWEITEFLYNLPAVAFWRAVVNDYTQGRFRESSTHGEIRQVFASRNVAVKR